MSKVCESSGKKPRSGGYKYVRSGIAKKQGGIGLKIRGRTLRWFRPNIQKIRVLLPNGAVRRMNLATSAIKRGFIRVKIDGKIRTIPLIKATRGRQTLYRKLKEQESR